MRIILFQQTGISSIKAEICLWNLSWGFRANYRENKKAKFYYNSRNWLYVFK